MSIISTFNEYLNEQQEKRKTYKGSSKIKPSGLGQCYRRQIYAIRQEPVTNPPDLKSVKRMLLGSVVHETLQKAYPDDQKEVLIETDYLKGYADIVTDDCVADIKTVSPWAYKWLEKPKIDISEEKKDNWLQVAVYGMYLNKPKIRLAFVNTGDLNKVAEFEQKTDDWRSKAQEEIDKVKDYLASKELPEPSPRLYGVDKEGDPRECQYCAWWDKCDNDKKKSGNSSNNKCDPTGA